MDLSKWLEALTGLSAQFDIQSPGETLQSLANSATLFIYDKYKAPSYKSIVSGCFKEIRLGNKECTRLKVKGTGLGMGIRF